VLGYGEIFGLVSALAAHGYIESAVTKTDVTLFAKLPATENYLSTHAVNSTIISFISLIIDQ